MTPCNQCRFSIFDEDAQFFFCRRWPPSFYVKMEERPHITPAGIGKKIEASPSSSFIPVMPNWWCGEGQPKEKPN